MTAWGLAETLWSLVVEPLLDMAPWHVSPPPVVEVPHVEMELRVICDRGRWIVDGPGGPGWGESYHSAWAALEGYFS